MACIPSLAASGVPEIPRVVPVLRPRALKEGPLEPSPRIA